MIWRAEITQVLDGDTFLVNWLDGYTPPSSFTDPNRIRMAGVDTNEINKTPPQSFADEATDRLEELLPVGTIVTLEANDEASGSNGRPLRHVFVGSTNIATVMIEEGLGLAVRPEAEPDNILEYFASIGIAQLKGVGM